jgi:hypothetical protein
MSALVSTITNSATEQNNVVLDTGLLLPFQLQGKKKVLPPACWAGTLSPRDQSRAWASASWRRNHDRCVRPDPSGVGRTTVDRGRRAHQFDVGGRGSAVRRRSARRCLRLFWKNLVASKSRPTICVCRRRRRPRASASRSARLPQRRAHTHSLVSREGPSRTAGSGE